MYKRQGEVFGFWVIEGPESLKEELPFEKAGLPVLITNDHKPYKQRKVRILNGAHTSFVLGAYLAGQDIVRDCMEDEVKMCIRDSIWKEDGTYHELLAEHVQAVKDVAVSTNTPVIDLHEFSVRFYEKTGMERSCGYFHPGDYTHTNEYGACLFASCIAAGLGRIFPEVFHVTAGPSDFTPPENLWDLLDSQNNRAGGTEQKEQFDAMEKSTAALLKALEEMCIRDRF